MSEPTQIIMADVSQPITEGQNCGSWESEIFFLAPIDLLPGDKVIIDPGSGQPLGVYRDTVLFWKFEGHYISGSVTAHFETDLDGYRALFAILGGQP